MVPLQFMADRRVASFRYHGCRDADQKRRWFEIAASTWWFERKRCEITTAFFSGALTWAICA